MYNKENWRFAGNNYANENGLDTADKETFKRNPIASLARESCQNSIDAKKEGEKKVIIEFKTFEIRNEEIPGYERLKIEIENCKEYKKDSKKEYEQLKHMYNTISKDKITCLRISDFNTTGLYGEKFYLLTKGSGITDKVGTTGGSKGIGKYASFVASSINTVFYSTYTKEEKEKSLGISKLCSAPMPNDPKQKTMGIGYYGINEKNEPIEEQLKLDKRFERKEYGTDIYVIGFKKEENWKKQMISMILDSFLVAIYYGELEVRIEDITINATNLGEIVKDENLIIENLKKSIVSQYILISEGEGVFTKEIDILEYGEVRISVKSFGREEKIATNSCTMIRYPYMKIKTFPNISMVPCSAMCIIKNNTLNEVLKDIENPQHTDWEPGRIDDEALKSEIKHIIQKLKNSILDFVKEVFTISETEKLDIEGAQEYLPEENTEGVETKGKEEKKVNKEKARILKKVKNKKYVQNPVRESDILEGTIPDIGGHEEEGEDSPVPSGKNRGNHGYPHESEETKGSTEEGDKDILRHVALTDMKKIFFAPNRTSGEYIVNIESNYNEKDCELELYYYDDGNNKYRANIEKCIVNNEETEIEEGKAIKFRITPGKVKIKIQTDLRDYYKCEVKLYANRK